MRKQALALAIALGAVAIPAPTHAQALCGFFSGRNATQCYADAAENRFQEIEQRQQDLERRLRAAERVNEERANERIVPSYLRDVSPRDSCGLSASLGSRC